MYHSLSTFSVLCFSDSHVDMSSLIRTFFDLLFLVTHSTLTMKQLSRLSETEVGRTSEAHFLFKPTRPHECACCPSPPVPVRKAYVGPDNKRALALWKRAAIMSHWGCIGRRGNIFDVIALSWQQQHQIGEEAPALKRLKSICTPECVELAIAHQPAEKEQKRIT